MWWQRNNWKNRCYRLEQKNERLREELKVCYQRMDADRERLTNADRNRMWCDAASNYLGPAAAAWLVKLQAISDAVIELEDEIQPIQDAYYQVGCHYPWDTRYQEEQDDSTTM